MSKSSFVLDLHSGQEDYVFRRLKLLMPAVAGEEAASSPLLRDYFGDIEVIDPNDASEECLASAEGAGQDTLWYVNSNFQRLKDTFALLHHGSGPVLLCPPVAPFPESFDGFVKNLRKLKRFVRLSRPFVFHAGLARLKEIVDSGVLGKVRDVELTIREKRPPRYSIDIRPGVEDGKELFNTFYHDLDIVVWLTESLPESLYLSKGNAGDGQHVLNGECQNGNGFLVKVIEDEAEDGESGSFCRISGEGGTVVYYGPVWCVRGRRQGCVKRKLARETPAVETTFTVNVLDPLIHEISAATHTYGRVPSVMWSKRDWPLNSLRTAYCLRNCL